MVAQPATPLSTGTAPYGMKYIEIYRKDVLNLLAATHYAHTALTGAQTNYRPNISSPEIGVPFYQQDFRRAFSLSAYSSLARRRDVCVSNVVDVADDHNCTDLKLRDSAEENCAETQA